MQFPIGQPLMRGFDFSSWQAVLTTLIGLVVVTLLGVGVRLLAMQTVQQRRERENRQINERLRTLIAAYRTLGGSFTGDLAVDPTHLRDLRRRHTEAVELEDSMGESGSDRARRIRDAVEAALSDIILLGTEEQVRLAALAAAELAAGRPVHTAELVVSLRDFIRRVLDLEPVPSSLSIPRQGPTRPGSSGSKGKGEGGAGKEDSRQGGKGGGGAGMGAGAGLGLGTGLAVDAGSADESGSAAPHGRT
jgi:heme exporter protein D